MYLKSAAAVVLLVLVGAIAGKDCHSKKSSSKLFCYYGKAKDIDSCKCSHIILPADADVKSIEGLRDKLGATKILLTVNEFNEGLVNTLKTTKVDGLEINLKKLDSKNDISDFISTVRSKLGSDLYLALSVPPKTETLAKYYDFKSLSKNADVFILQTHLLGVSKNVTFHPSRLSGLWDVQNTDSVVDLVSGLGAPLTKLVITAPVQGFKFTLQNEKHTAPGSPALELSTLTRDQLCEKMRSDKWMLERDQDQAGPYIFRKNEWVSFEDSMSMDIKAKYSRVRGLAGLALKDLSQDGGSKCGETLLKSAYSGLSKQARAPRGAVLHSLEREILQTSPSKILDNVQVSPYRISRVIDVEGKVHVIRQDTRTEFACSRQGYFVHPRSCGRFYRCVKFDQLSDEFSVFEFDCPAGLAFDERVEVCVWPGSLPHASACSGSSEIAPVPRERFICPGEQGYYADPENCRWFFACLDHGKSPLSAYEFRCPYGLVFDEERLMCEWPWLVPKCGSGYASGSVHGEEYHYGGLHASSGSAIGLDLYDGLGSLNAVKLGGLSGPLVQPIQKTYSSLGTSHDIVANVFGVQPQISIGAGGSHHQNSGYSANANGFGGSGIYVAGSGSQFGQSKSTLGASRTGLETANIDHSIGYHAGADSARYYSSSDESGSYKHDNSGDYNTDNSGSYKADYSASHLNGGLENSGTFVAASGSGNSGTHISNYPDSQIGIAALNGADASASYISDNSGSYEHDVSGNYNSQVLAENLNSGAFISGIEQSGAQGSSGNTINHSGSSRIGGSGIHEIDNSGSYKHDVSGNYKGEHSGAYVALSHENINSGTKQSGASAAGSSGITINHSGSYKIGGSEIYATDNSGSYKHDVSGSYNGGNSGAYVAVSEKNINSGTYNLGTEQSGASAAGSSGIIINHSESYNTGGSGTYETDNSGSYKHDASGSYIARNSGIYGGGSGSINIGYSGGISVGGSNSYASDNSGSYKLDTSGSYNKENNNGAAYTGISGKGQSGSYSSGSGSINIDHSTGATSSYRIDNSENIKHSSSGSYNSGNSGIYTLGSETLNIDKSGSLGVQTNTYNLNSGSYKYDTLGSYNVGDSNLYVSGKNTNSPTHYATANTAESAENSGSSGTGGSVSYNSDNSGTYKYDTSGSYNSENAGISVTGNSASYGSENSGVQSESYNVDHSGNANLEIYKSGILSSGSAQAEHSKSESYSSAAAVSHSYQHSSTSGESATYKEDNSGAYIADNSGSYVADNSGSYKSEHSGSYSSAHSGSYKEQASHGASGSYVVENSGSLLGENGHSGSYAAQHSGSTSGKYNSGSSYSSVTSGSQSSSSSASASNTGTSDGLYTVNYNDQSSKSNSAGESYSYSHSSQSAGNSNYNLELKHEQEQLGQINIVAGGASGVGIAKGVEILQHGINLGGIEHVTPLPVVSSTIPSVTSVPLPAKSGLEFFNGGVVANVPDLQLKIEHPSTINAYLGNFGTYKEAKAKHLGFSNYTHLVSSTQAPLVIKSDIISSGFDVAKVNTAEDYKHSTILGQVVGDNGGYIYPKPSVAFEEKRTYLPPASVEYLPPASTTKLPEVPSIYLPAVSTTPATYLPPVSPTVYLLPSTTPKPTAAVYLPPAPSTYLPPKSYSYGRRTSHKSSYVLPSKPVQGLKLGVIESQSYQNRQRGYQYVKPTIAFEEKPVSFEQKTIVQPAVTYQHIQQKAIVQPAVTYQEIKHNIQPITIHKQVKPAVTFQNIKSEGYNYEKPTISFEEKPTKPLVAYKEVKQVQPVIQKTENKEGYHYEKPVVAFEEKPVVLQEIKHEHTPSVAYQEVNVKQEEGYHYDESAAAFGQKTEHKSVSYQQVKHKTAQQIEAYHYEKPSVVFEEKPIIHEQIRPAITYQEIKHDVHTPALPYQEIKKETSDGYHYEKPAIVFEEKPAVTFHSTVQPTQKIITPSVAYQQVKNEHHYYEKSEEPLIQPAIIQTPVTYQEDKVEQKGYTYERPTVTFEEKPQVHSYFHQKQAEQKEQHAVAYQEIKHEGYHYEKPTIPFEERPVVHVQQPVTANPVVTYQEYKPTVSISQPIVNQEPKPALTLSQPAVTYHEINVKPVAIAHEQEGYHYEKPAIKFEHKQVNVEHKQNNAEHKQVHVEDYRYEKPVVAFEEVQQKTVIQPAVTYQEIVQPVVYEQKPTYKEVVTKISKPAIISSFSIQQPIQKIVHKQNYLPPAQPTQTYLPVQPVKTYIPAQPEPTYLPAPRPTLKYLPAVKPTKEYLPVPKETYVPAPKPTLEYLPAPKPSPAYIPVVKPIETYIPVKQDTVVESYFNNNHQVKHEYQSAVAIDYNEQEEVSEQPIVAKKTFLTYQKESSSGYDYPKPEVAFEEEPETIKHVPLAENFYTYDSRLSQKEENVLINKEVTINENTPVLTTSRPIVRYEFSSLDQKYNNYENYEIQKETSLPVTTRRPVVTTPRRQYLPVTTPKQTYLPVTTQKRTYRPVTTLKRVYLPVTTTERYVEITSPNNEYLPVTQEIYKIKTPAREYLPVTSAKPSREYLPVTTPRPIRVKTAKPNREYLPVTTGKPSKEYLPVTTVKPSKEYLPVKTEKPNREYLPARSRTRKPSTKYLPVTPEQPNLEYLPVEITKTVEDYKVQDVAISTRRPKTKITKAKTIVKVNDFHPILSAKLGAQCTCVSNTLTLRKKPKTLNIERENYPAGYEIIDGKYSSRKETERDNYPAGYVVDNESYPDNEKYDGDYDNDEGDNPVIKDLVDVVVEDFKYEPERISVKPTEALYIEEPSSEAIDILINKGRKQSVRVIKKKKPSKEEIAVAVDTGLELVKSAVKEGVKEGVKEALESKDFDRYGPGGVRGRTETLQGTIDCQRAGLFRHPKHCNKFYACRWDCDKKKFTLHVFNCPVHLTFDNSLGACNWPSQGPACVDNTLLPSV